MLRNGVNIRKLTSPGISGVHYIVELQFMQKKFNIEYYTDPLCCWSWAMEPQWRKLKFLLKDKLEYRYVMGGLLRDWNHYQDDLNSIGRPSQMGPLWMEAKHISGQPMEESIWIDAPINSSYPACMAVKAAENQSFVAGEAMLRELREAVMFKKKNIAEADVIVEIAEKLAEDKILNFEAFDKCFFSEESAELFKADKDKTKLNNITRFPSMLINYGDKIYQITGYRPFTVLLETFKALEPNLKLDENINIEEYKSSYVHLTDKEIAEAENSSTRKDLETATRKV